MTNHALFVKVVGLAVIVASCGGGSDGPTETTPGALAISLSSSSGTVEQGSSLKLTATVTRSGVLPGSLTISGTGVPNGMSVTVGLIQGSGATSTASVTIQTAVSVTPGSYEITFQASGNGLGTAATSFQLFVTQRPVINISLTPAPSTIALTAGTSNSTKTVSIERTLFAGAVTLTADGLPMGVTASFAGSPLTGTSSVMTLSAAPTAPVSGPTAVTIRGSGSATAQASTTFQLTVLAAPSIALSMTPPPASLSIPIGGSSAAKTINIARTNYSGPVTLTAEGLPDGVTASFAENPTTGGASIMTMTVGPGLPAGGPHPITIRGSGPDPAFQPGVAGAIQNTIDFSLTIDPAILTAVAPGEQHGCVRATNNAIYCWGRNTSGQLGHGSSSIGSAAPVKVGGGVNFRSVHTGKDFACGIATDDRGFCWGDNDHGQLGNGTTNDSNIPVEIAGNHRWATMGHGDRTGCGITTGGVTHCWGDNTFGQVGDGTTTRRLTPVPVSGGHSFTSLGRYGGDALMHMCAIRADQQLYCWGDNQSGQIGDGTTVNRLTPTPVAGGPWLHVGLAANGNCALRTTGAMLCWGINTFGRLGDGTTDSRSVPTVVSSTETYRAIGMGRDHTCAVSSSGAAFCWGLNLSGQLGDGSGLNRLVPFAVAGGHMFLDVRSGRDHSCGLRNDGRVLCWGNNQDAQLGDGTFESRNVPTLILPIPPN